MVIALVMRKAEPKVAPEFPCDPNTLSFLLSFLPPHQLPCCLTTKGREMTVSIKHFLCTSHQLAQCLKCINLLLHVSKEATEQGRWCYHPGEIRL